MKRSPRSTLTRGRRTGGPSRRSAAGSEPSASRTVPKPVEVPAHPVNVPSKKALVYWLNSLGIESAIMVDKLEDLAAPGDSTLQDVINVIVSGPESKLPVPSSVGSALLLLAKHEGWENLAPKLCSLSPEDIAARIQERNDVAILRLLVASLRVLFVKKQKERAAGTAVDYQLPPSPSAFGRTTRQRTTDNRQAKSRKKGSQLENLKGEKLDIENLGSSGFSNLSNKQLEILQKRVKKMMLAEQQAAAEEKAREENAAKVPDSSPTRRRVKIHTRAWVPEGGWNSSTASQSESKKADTSTKAQLLRANMVRTQGNRNFIKGVGKVDKTGMTAHGMHDPTYAPSVKRLYELGFSPSKVKRLQTERRGGGSGGYAPSASGRSVTFAPSETLESRADYAPSERPPPRSGLSERAKYRRKAALKSAEDRQTWEKKLRTPSKDRKSRVAWEEDRTREQERNGGNVVSMALSEKQNTILKWVRQNGIDPCPEVKANMVTSHSFANSFSNGVLLCNLVAGLELRAGGRGLHQISKTAAGNLSLEGVQMHPRTTGACTGNINIALKVLRRRKKMSPRHLWAATQIRNGEPMIVWQLLEDIRKEYSSSLPKSRRLTEKRRKLEDQARKAEQLSRAKKKNVHKVPSRRGSNLSLGIHRDLLGHTASASQRMPFGLLDPEEQLSFSSRMQSSSGYHPRMSTSQRSKGSPLGRGKLRKSRKIDPAILVFHASKGNAKGSAPDSQYAFQGIGVEQEEVLRTWLKQMGFTVPPSNNAGSPLSITKDPLRNGTVMCALVQILDPDHAKELMKNVHRKPYSVKQAKENVDRALSVLRARMYSAIPAPYLFQSEAIVKGTRAVLWGILWHLKRVMDSFAPNPSELRNVTKSLIARKERAKVESNLEYTLEERWQLERSLLSWLYSLNVLENNMVVPHDFVEIDKEVRDGTLLCKTVGTVRGVHVIGWNRKPRKAKIGRENLEKALKAIRETAGMGQRHAWKGDEIYRGERLHILGVFEDLHRYFDDIPARPTFRTKKESPYFGSHVPAPQDMTLPHPHLAFPPSGTGASLLVGSRRVDPSKTMREHDVDVIEAARLDADSAAASATARIIPLHGSENNEKSSVGAYASSFYDDISDIFPQHTSTGVSASSSKMLGGDISGSAASDFKALGSMFVDRDSAMDIVPSSSRHGSDYGPSMISSTSEHSKAVVDAARRRRSRRVRDFDIDGSTNPGEGGGTISELMEEDVLVKWVRSLGVVVERPDDFHKDKAPEWSTGVKFCRVIEAVHHSRMNIRGVVEEPKNTAQCINNFRRGLEVLRQKSNMPVELLFSEDRLVDADTDLLVPLLQAIRKAYGQHFKPTVFGAKLK